LTLILDDATCHIRRSTPSTFTTSLDTPATTCPRGGSACPCRHWHSLHNLDTHANPTQTAAKMIPSRRKPARSGLACASPLHPPPPRYGRRASSWTTSPGCGCNPDAVRCVVPWPVHIPHPHSASRSPGPHGASIDMTVRCTIRSAWIPAIHDRWVDEGMT